MLYDYLILAIGIIATFGLVWLLWKYWTRDTEATTAGQIGALLIVISFVLTHDTHTLFIEIGETGEIAVDVLSMGVLGAGIWILLHTR